MPEIGDKIRASEIGYKHNRLMIWSKCKDCRNGRWTETRNGISVCGPRCQKCAASYYGKKTPKKKGKDHWHWKGGRSKMTNGYIEIWMSPDDPFYPMAFKDGYLTEHRLVMARYLGRLLASDEEVHHKNRNKHDNRIENLELLSKVDHSSNLKEIQRLTERILELETENDELKAKTS